MQKAASLLALNSFLNARIKGDKGEMSFLAREGTFFVVVVFMSENMNIFLFSPNKFPVSPAPKITVFQPKRGLGTAAVGIGMRAHALSWAGEMGRCGKLQCGCPKQ